MSTTADTIRGPRVRFNWGFHDAQHHCEAQIDRPGHSDDPAYNAGYEWGVREYSVNNGVRSASSSNAWEKYTVLSDVEIRILSHLATRATAEYLTIEDIEVQLPHEVDIIDSLDSLINLGLVNRGIFDGVDIHKISKYGKQTFNQGCWRS